MGGTGESFARWMGNADYACPLAIREPPLAYFCIGIEGSSARRLDDWPNLAFWRIHGCWQVSLWNSLILAS
jgi:hypothetical protein